MGPRIWSTAVAATLVAACGGSSPAAPPQAISVGGTYALTKTVLEDACGGAIRTFVFTARVRHDPGSSSFVLTDSFNDLPGRVESDGSFAIPATRTGTESGAAVVSTFEPGRFTATGFEVAVRIDIDRPSGTPPGPACRVRESWAGLKQGTPNVLP